MNSTGFVIGLVGGLLDFASATEMLVGGMGMMAPQAFMGIPQFAWAAALYILGACVILTTLASATLYAMAMRRTFSVLMIVYGVLMFAFGGAMVSGLTSAPAFYGYAMLAVGVIMLGDGAMKTKSPSSRL